MSLPTFKVNGDIDKIWLFHLPYLTFDISIAIFFSSAKKCEISVKKCEMFVWMVVIFLLTWHGCLHSWSFCKWLLLPSSEIRSSFSVVLTIYCSYLVDGKSVKSNMENILLVSFKFSSTLSFFRCLLISMHWKYWWTLSMS